MAKQKVEWFLIGILTIVFCLVSISFAAEPEIPKPKFHVKVIVGGNENIKELVTSCIQRELRSLQDVEIVNSQQEWELKILAMEILTKGLHQAGIIMSVVILDKVHAYYKKHRYKTNPGEFYFYSYTDNWLQVSTMKDLKNLCAKIVADFDTEYLENDRRGGIF
jgi:hypothetical protein